MQAKRANSSVAKSATHRAACPGPSAGKERPPQDDNLRLSFVEAVVFFQDFAEAVVG